MKNRLKKKCQQKASVKRRIRKKVSGTEARPRLSVFRSNLHMYVQAINDESGVTICSASTVEKDGRDKTKKADQAKFIGETVAARLIEKGISAVVYDRNGYPYHGVVKQVADSAREKGLTI